MMRLKKKVFYWMCGMMLTGPFCGMAAELKPNILLIMADDVGSEAIGCYGGQSYPTPHIDALATGGVKFNHGYAMPVCHPSRICLMTGRYPFRFGDEGSKWGDFPRSAEPITIGLRMKQGGYATAVAGKWQLCLMKNDLDHPKRLGFDQWSLFGWHEGGRYHNPMIYENGKLLDDTSGKFGPDLYVDFLVDFMQRNHKVKKPFFAYYPMALCHDVTNDLDDEHVDFYKDGRWMNYAEMIASMDDMVGRLIAALQRMGARDNTLVIFTTDNGSAGASYLSVNSEGNMIKSKVVSVRKGRVVPGGKGKMDDTGTRVPLIANWPGHIQPKSKTDRMVDLTDILPTLAEVAGLSDDGVVRDGISFASTLLTSAHPENASDEREWIFIEYRGKRCVRSRNWKLYGDGRFFDLMNDPGESSPLSPNQRTEKMNGSYTELTSVIAGLKGYVQEKLRPL